MSRPAARRYPWPHHLIPTPPHPHHDHDGYQTDTDHAHTLNVTRRTILRYKRDGLTYWQADQLATHILTTHPSLIWVDWNTTT